MNIWKVYRGSDWFQQMYLNILWFYIVTRAYSNLIWPRKMTATNTVDSSAFVAEKVSVEKEEEFPTSIHDCNREIDIHELEYELNEAIEEILRKDDEIKMLKNAKFSAIVDTLLKVLISTLILYFTKIYVQEELQGDNNYTNANLRMFPFSLIGIFCSSLFIYKLFASKHVAWIW